MHMHASIHHAPSIEQYYTISSTMDAKWDIQHVSNKIIKPSIPTPSHLKTYNLSLLDQLTPASYIPIALFYPHDHSLNQQIPQILEKSLPELLTSHYPFAGTLSEDGISIECNDKGCPFTQVVINVPMSEFIKEGNARFQDVVFSNNIIACGTSSPEDYLLYVQLTHFDCGGKALSSRICHRIADGCTLIDFMSDWAAMTSALLQSSGGVDPVDHERPSPQLIGASLLPPTNDPIAPSYTGESQVKVVCKRYTFNGKSLAELKALIAAENDEPVSSSCETKPPYITRVELVTALLYKCVVAAASKTRTQLQGSSTSMIKPSNLIQVANLRRMTTPQLAPNVVGNWYTYMDIVIESEEQMKLSSLIKEQKKEKLELQKKLKKCYDGTSKNELRNLVLENDKKMAVRYEKDVYLCTSFCGYPFYKIDFGFGNPIWATLASVHANKIFVLMDNPEGDGVEALVALEEKIIPLFEDEEEIRTFATWIL